MPSSCTASLLPAPGVFVGLADAGARWCTSVNDFISTLTRRRVVVGRSPAALIECMASADRFPNGFAKRLDFVGPGVFIR